MTLSLNRLVDCKMLKSHERSYDFGQTPPFEHSHEIIPTNCSAFIEHSLVCIVCIIFSISRVSQHGCICFYEQELQNRA